MFGTGLDIERAQQRMPGERARLGYYDGHYTSMWYAAFRNSLIPSGIKPKVVVWGFRPTYAVFPAFRKNGPTQLDKVFDSDDKVFLDILARAESGVSTKAAFERGMQFSFWEWLQSVAPITREREGLSAAINASFSRWIASIFSPNNENAQYLLDTPSAKISDLIVSFATGGEVRRADALVVDNGERFVVGNAMAFNQSFVPLTASLLRQNDIPQLVVIFKPVAVFGEGMPPEPQAYYEDAIAYLKSNDIPYIDFIADPALTEDLYAKGDHFTAEGMAYVTEQIVQALGRYGLAETVLPPGAQR